MQRQCRDNAETMQIVIQGFHSRLHNCMTNSNDPKNSFVKANRAAILKELESVRNLLKEDSDRLGELEAQSKRRNQPPVTENIAREEFQIPLLDPGKSTTYELDFSKPEVKTLAPVVTPVPAEIPVLDDITHSGSLFSDDEEDTEVPKQKTSLLTKTELRDQAQLIVQDLLNEIIPDIQDKLDAMIPGLEEQVKKRLDKVMNDYIEKSLKS